MQFIKQVNLIIFAILPLTGMSHVKGEDGYRMCLRYVKIENQCLPDEYKSQINSIHSTAETPALESEWNRERIFIIAASEDVDVLQKFGTNYLHPGLLVWPIENTRTMIIKSDY